MLDDQVETLQSEGFIDSWRLWLHLSNVIGWRDEMSGVEILALSQVIDAVAPTATLGPVDMALTDLSIEWQGLVEQASPRERELILGLVDASIGSLPVMGLELGDGIPVSFVWKDARVASTWGLDDDDRSAIAREGWTVVEPEASAIVEALSAGRN